MNFLSGQFGKLILINFALDKSDKELFEKFLKKWHKKDFDVSIIKPKEGHFLHLLNLAQIHFSQNLPNGKRLNLQNYADQVLISLRDYAHHFAISYHRKLSSFT